MRGQKRPEIYNQQSYNPDQQHYHHRLATEPPARRPVEDMKAARNSARPAEKAAEKAARFAVHCGSPTLQYFEHRPDQSVDDGLGAIFFARSDVANRLISVSAPCHQSDLTASLLQLAGTHGVSFEASVSAVQLVDICLASHSIPSIFAFECCNPFDFLAWSALRLASFQYGAASRITLVSTVPR